MESLSDRELLEIFGNPETKNYGFSLLVRKYQERVYRHIRRMVILHEDADDLVQETFVKVWKNLAGFRNESGLFTWIYRIATNETLTFLKQKRRFLFEPLISSKVKMIRALKDDNFYNGTEVEQKLQLALLDLPEKQRIVFNLRYYDEMPYDQMSELLGTSEGALKASYHHAVKKIEAKVMAD
ncbi:MAG: RNA polymerase sigma factor [Bacteroidales bacterium]|nr:RNA polymerase sigma factor [Bacteroidales bacterium]